jgi:hypothetical protein
VGEAVVRVGTFVVGGPVGPRVGVSEGKLLSLAVGGVVGRKVGRGATGAAACDGLGVGASGTPVCCSCMTAVVGEAVAYSSAVGLAATETFKT